MTHTCCPACMLRIAQAAAGSHAACPVCGEHLTSASAAEVLGFALLAPAAARPVAAHVAVALVRTAPAADPPPS